MNFLVADKLAIGVLLVTCFLKKHMLAIKCTGQQVRLRGSTIPILGTRLGPYANQKGKGPVEDEEEFEVEKSATGKPLPPKSKSRTGDRLSERIRLAKGLTLEPLTPKAVRVVSEASGLIFIEPRAKVQQSYQVRVANSLAEVEKGKPFTILISNFGKTVKKFPKGMVVASVAPNPLALLTVGGEVGRRLATCLNIVGDDTQNASSSKRLVDSSLPDATGQPGDDWTSHVDLRHLTDEILKRDILQMMSHHNNLWGGHLGW